MILLETRDAYWANISFIITGVIVGCGAIWRVLILPNLRRDEPTSTTIATQNDEQLKLLRRAVDQLTKNGGKNNPATLPDVAHELRTLRAEFKVREIKDEQWRDEHRAYSDEQLALVNERLERLEDKR